MVEPSSVFSPSTISNSCSGNTSAPSLSPPFPLPPPLLLPPPLSSVLRRCRSKKLPKNLAVKEKLRTFAPANEDKGV